MASFAAGSRTRAETGVVCGDCATTGVIAAWLGNVAALKEGADTED